MRRLGILGTLVWDTIHAPGEPGPVEDWGGIAYSLCAFDALAPAGWEPVPIVRVGADLRVEADRLLDGLATMRDRSGVRTVPEPNNRVELFYDDGPRRCEKLTGGVPGWSAAELVPLVLSCDALYVNMIAGWELDLDVARDLRAAFPGPVYCDVHSLLLGVGPDGVRRYRPLPDWPAWRRCFDLLQMNEEELAVVAAGAADPFQAARQALDDGVEAVFLTLGERGVRWIAREDARWLAGGPDGDVGGRQPEGVRVASAPRDVVDPTGCGDVWGASCFASLLGGRGLPGAVDVANALASRCAVEKGTRALVGALAQAAGSVTPVAPGGGP
jgi:hypothetical protein